jgi:hypothetical protein
MKIIGLVGLLAIVACWIPQTREVLKSKRADMNFLFLILYLVGSNAQTTYALGDAFFLTLNLLPSIGRSTDFYCKMFPKTEEVKETKWK